MSDYTGKHIRGFLRDLGIYGWDNLENIIYASLITGDPLIFVGSHGEAKTTIARQVSKAMGINFGEFNCAMSNFEDVLGFPNVNSAKEGKLEYIDSPNCIWNKEFVFLDELSRSNQSMQNKWLEVIRSRSINGLKTNAKFVWSAMNPINESYSATKPLDIALAERFAFILDIPEASSMRFDDQASIIGMIGIDDSPMIQYEMRASTPSFERGQYALNNRLEKARKIYKDLLGIYGAKTSEYVKTVVATLEEANIHISGRRMAMVYRSLLACLTAHLAINAISEIDDLDILRIYNVSLKSLFSFMLVGEKNFNTILLGKCREFGRESYLNCKTPDQFCLLRCKTVKELANFINANPSANLDLTSIKYDFYKNFENTPLVVSFPYMLSCLLRAPEVSKSIASLLMSIFELPEKHIGTLNGEGLISCIAMTPHLSFTASSSSVTHMNNDNSLSNLLGDSTNAISILASVKSNINTGFETKIG